MIFWGSGSWVLSGPPGKLQAYQVRNQINTPAAGGCSKEDSGFLEPPHPARPNCHLSLPWDAGLFFSSQTPRNRTGLWGTQGDADLGDQSVFDNFWTQAGADQPCPHPMPGHRPPNVPGCSELLLSRRRQAVFTLHTTLICWWWPPEFGADHFEILSRVERKNIKVDN